MNPNQVNPANPPIAVNYSTLVPTQVSVPQQPELPANPPPAVDQNLKGGSMFKKLLILFFVFILVVSVLSGAAYAIAYEKVAINNPQFSEVFLRVKYPVSKAVFSLPFTPKTPKFLLTETVLVQDKVNKYSFNVSYALKTNQSEIVTSLGTNQLDGEIKGKVDFSNTEKIKLSAIASLTKDFSADVRMMDKILYVKINKVPEVLFTALGINSKDVASLWENWIEVDLSTLETEASKNLATHSKENSESEEEAKKLLSALMSDKILNSIEITEDKLGDDLCYKMEFKADSKMIDYIDGVIKEQTEGGSSLQLDGQKASDTLKDLTIELWTDKKDSNLRKVAIYARAVPPKLDNLSEPLSVLGVNTMSIQPTTQLETELSFVILFSDYGEDFSVEKPEKTIKPEEFAKSLMQQSQMYQQMISQSQDSVIIFDLSALQKVLAVCYVENNRYPKTLEEITTGTCSTISLPEVPTNQVTKQPYQYYTNALQSRYYLKTTMSRGNECLVTESIAASATVCSPRQISQQVWPPPNLP